MITAEACSSIGSSQGRVTRAAGRADRVVRYNIFPAAVLQGQPAPGISSGESLNVVESMADAKLPPGMTYEWTALSYQEKLVGSQAIVVFAMALLVVYLILAALYESWFIPLSVILSIPLAVLGIVLSISGPSMLIAWLKLRQRSLGPILDASGWAINNRMKLSTRLGGSLTKRPQPVPHAVKLPEIRRTARDGGPSAGAPAAAVSEPSL